MNPEEILRQMLDRGEISYSQYQRDLDNLRMFGDDPQGVETSPSSQPSLFDTQAGQAPPRQMSQDPSGEVDSRGRIVGGKDYSSQEEYDPYEGMGMFQRGRAKRAERRFERKFGTEPSMGQGQYESQEDYIEQMQEAQAGSPDAKSYEQLAQEYDQMGQPQGGGQTTGQSAFMGPRYLNPWGGDMNTNAYMLGRAFGSEKGSRGRGLGIASGIGNLGLGLARTIGSGVGYAKRYDETMDTYRRDRTMDRNYTNQPSYYDTNMTGGQMGKYGGEKKYEYGGETDSTPIDRYQRIMNSQSYMKNGGKKMYQNGGGPGDPPPIRVRDPSDKRLVEYQEKKKLRDLLEKENTWKQDRYLSVGPSADIDKYIDKSSRSDLERLKRKYNPSVDPDRKPVTSMSMGSGDSKQIDFYLAPELGRPVEYVEEEKPVEHSLSPLAPEQADRALAPNKGSSTRYRLHTETDPYTNESRVMSRSQKMELDRRHWKGEGFPEDFKPELYDAVSRRRVTLDDLGNYDLPEGIENPVSGAIRNRKFAMGGQVGEMQTELDMLMQLKSVDAPNFTPEDDNRLKQLDTSLKQFMQEGGEVQQEQEAQGGQGEIDPELLQIAQEMAQEFGSAEEVQAYLEQEGVRPEMIEQVVELFLMVQQEQGQQQERQPATSGVMRNTMSGGMSMEFRYGGRKKYPKL